MSNPFLNFKVTASSEASYGNDYLSDSRRGFAQLIKKSGDKPLKDVQKELRALINDVASSTRAATLEEVRKKFEDEGY